MNNQWIRIFGELLPSYETFLEGKKFTNYNNEEEIVFTKTLLTQTYFYCDDVIISSYPVLKYCV